MRKIIVGTQVSMDGVMQAPGGRGIAKLFKEITKYAVSRSGIMIGHHECAGEIKIGGTELDAPSEREIARQERMKRDG